MNEIRTDRIIKPHTFVHQTTTKGEVAMKRINVAAFTVLTILLIQSANALAMTTPAAGSFAYDLYDIAVTKILLGPIGFVAGVASMVFAAILAIRQMILPAAGVVLGGAFLLSADSVVTSIGSVII
jgi:hypothetical protein